MSTTMKGSYSGGKNSNYNNNNNDARNHNEAVIVPRSIPVQRSHDALARAAVLLRVLRVHSGAGRLDEKDDELLRTMLQGIRRRLSCG